MTGTCWDPFTCAGGDQVVDLLDAMSHRVTRSRNGADVARPCHEVILLGIEVDYSASVGQFDIPDWPLGRQVIASRLLRLVSTL